MAYRIARSRPVILLDCDGVLADFIGGVLEIVEEITALSFDREDVDRFDFCEALGVSVDDGRAIKRAIADRGFCDRLVPYEGARAGVRELQEIADVRIVTSPWDSSPTWTYERESWLWRLFKIPHAHITHSREKFRIAGDVFVDDKTIAVAEWSAAWPDGLAVRWTTPHNGRDQWDGVATRDWDHLVAMVRLEAEHPGIARDARRLDAEIRAGFGGR